MFIDSHAHIDGPEFDSDRAEVIQRAQSSGISVILNVGTGDPHGGVFERAVELGEKHDCVYTAIGPHPHESSLSLHGAEPISRPPAGRRRLPVRSRPSPL